MNIPLILVFLGILFTMIGGMMDMTGQDKIFESISKQHFWNDGLCLILLAIFIKIKN